MNEPERLMVRYQILMRYRVSVGWDSWQSSIYQTMQMKILHRLTHPLGESKEEDREREADHQGR